MWRAVAFAAVLLIIVPCDAQALLGFSGPFTYTYLRGYVQAPYAFRTLTEAQNSALGNPDAGGITYEPYTGNYTVRKSSVPQDNPVNVNEITWVKNQVTVPRGGMIVVLVSVRNDKYCRSDFNTLKIFCDSNKMIARTRFAVHTVGGDRVALQDAATGRLCCDEPGRIICDRGAVGDYELFSVQVIDRRVILRGGRQGQFCRDAGENGLICDQATRNTTEGFIVGCVENCGVLVPKPGMTIGIVSNRNQNLCTYAGVRIQCGGTDVDKALFQVYDANDGRVALKSLSYNFCADEGNAIVCNRQSIGDWERFSVQAIGDGVAFRGGQNQGWCRDWEPRQGGMSCDITSTLNAPIFRVVCFSGCLGQANYTAFVPGVLGLKLTWAGTSASFASNSTAKDSVVQLLSSTLGVPTQQVFVTLFPIYGRGRRRLGSTLEASGCSVVDIGSSSTSTKKVTLPVAEMRCTSTPVNQQGSWSDRFSVNVTRQELTVTRVDQPIGWGQALQLRCCPASACSVAEVGSSSTNTKTVTLPFADMLCLNTPLNQQEVHWRDSFTASVSRQALTVTRADQGGGWGQILQLQCCPAANVYGSFSVSLPSSASGFGANATQTFQRIRQVESWRASFETRLQEVLNSSGMLNPPAVAVVSTVLQQQSPIVWLGSVPSAPSPAPSPSPDPSGLSGGAIAGIVLGSIFGPLCCCCLVIWVRTRSSGSGSGAKAPAAAAAGAPLATAVAPAIGAAPTTTPAEDLQRAVDAAQVADLSTVNYGRTKLRRVAEQDVLETLQGLLETRASWLGSGRDVKAAGSYSRLSLAAAWRVEHSSDLKMYGVAKEELTDSATTAKVPRVSVATHGKADSLLGPLDSNINEAVLLHGTNPNALLSILANGLDEKFSTGLFGDGTYLAEDAGKTDQYTVADTQKQGGNRLHEILYPGDTQHPGDVFYILVCRALLGHAAHTKDGKVHDGSSNTIWAHGGRRELVPIPGSDPPRPYHSLVAELGATIVRYREFIIFHSDQVVTDYLVAYQRRR